VPDSLDTTEVPYTLHRFAFEHDLRIPVSIMQLRIDFQWLYTALRHEALRRRELLVRPKRENQDGDVRPRTLDSTSSPTNKSRLARRKPEADNRRKYPLETNPSKVRAGDSWQNLV
jgi:hypothetical protein